MHAASRASTTLISPWYHQLASSCMPVVAGLPAPGRDGGTVCESLAPSSWEESRPPGDSEWASLRAQRAQLAAQCRCRRPRRGAGRPQGGQTTAPCRGPHADACHRTGMHLLAAQWPALLAGAAGLSNGPCQRGRRAAAHTVAASSNIPDPTRTRPDLRVTQERAALMPLATGGWRATSTHLGGTLRLTGWY